MIRYNYLPLSGVDNSINFYDLTKLDWNAFQFKRGIKTYKLSSQDIDRFYLVVEKFYENILSEDWIYFVNKVPDPTELYVGQELIIPSILDIQDFLKDQLGVQS
jgi:hypothetical protein